MEYSVNDLIRILLKKWYVILLAMCLLGGLSTITARKSYENAVAQYAEYTANTPASVPEVGTCISIYQYGFQVNDLSLYVSRAKNKEAFIQQFMEDYRGSSLNQEETADLYTLAEQAYSEATADCGKLLTDAAVMEKTQQAANESQMQEPASVNEDGDLQESGPLCVPNYLSLSQTSPNTFQIQVYGLEETVARQLIGYYLENIQTVGRDTYFMELRMTELSQEFIPNPVPMDASVQFSQIVMQAPPQPPVLIKTVGTAMAFAFVLTCFLLLLWTFVKDSRAAAKNNRV